MRVRLLLVLVLVALAWRSDATHAETFAIQNGPRGFTPAPKDISAVTFTYERLQGRLTHNGIYLKNFEILTNSYVVSYTRYFDFFGKAASAVVALPYVDLKGEANTAATVFPVFSGAGISDPYFQFYSPICGGRALSKEEYFTSEPGFVLGAYAAVRPPLGDYNSSKPANVGANRWEFRVGLPIQYIIGRPTKQTTFEFVPALYLLGDNKEAFGGGTLSQDPVVHLEGHITRDFSKMFWGSLNVLHAFGGETSVGGVRQDNEIRYTAAGVTLGARLTKFMGANASYSRRVDSKQDNTGGEWFRFSVTFTF